MDWTHGAPYLDRAAVVISLVLGLVSITWIAIQARRGATTHRIAVEAHDWARERRDADRAAAEEQAAKVAWFEEMRRRIDAAAPRFHVEIPEGSDPEWLTQGEGLGYFRVVSGTFDDPGPLFARWSPRR